MLYYDQNTLREIQLVQLEMLIEVDRICRKHRIRYQIIAGTELGAVRHGGYIPWDDDADIAMLRSEYERFVEVCRTELDTERFYFQDHRETPGYRWGYGKLRRKDTLFLREYQEHMPYEQGIFIDIFPLDGVPDSYFLRALKNFECFCVRKILWSKVGRNADRSPAKRLAFSLLSRIPERAVLSYLDRMIARAPTRSRMVRILMFTTPNRAYGYPTKYYLSAAPTVFEGHTFPGAKDARGYLSFKFGDYMTLPPPEQRKTHPVSALKLPGGKIMR